ncbi:MAG: hypothetical protein JNK76_19100 [Planctomycetales bacterium]|nr:hypothetical protein [Planctomycetales bacterium]MBN8626612.1 hypothetical protein [Planctomycetota bacterium]
MRWYQPLAYLWASPATLLGLLPAPIVLAQRGQVRVVRGVVEIHGGIVTRLLSGWMPWIGHASAMTLGHVIWGNNQQCLDHSRDHEHVHVRQYERWGPLFLPAYLGASVYLWCRGRDPYLENPFEREAYGFDD